MFKKNVQSQGESKSAKFNVDKGGSSKDDKPTCANFGKKHDGECLLGTRSFFGCDKDGHKVRDCLIISTTGKKG